MALQKRRNNTTTPSADPPPTPSKKVHVIITPPDFKIGEFLIEGTAPLVQHAFSVKAAGQIRVTQEAGQKAKKGKKREPRDFDRDYLEAQHISVEGWNGVPATGCRNALIAACRLVGFQMTLGKMTLFVLADGYEADGTPLVKIIRGKPEPTGPKPVRNDDGSVDLRNRPIWHEWAIKLRVRYDADFFSWEDVANLVSRAFEQVGICEGRPFSKNSAGMGWGTGHIVNK